MRIEKVGEKTLVEGLGSLILCPQDQYILEVAGELEVHACGLHFWQIDFSSWSAKFKATKGVLRYIWLNEWYK